MSEWIAEHSSLPYFISTDISQFDMRRIHTWLSNSYWARGIPLDIVKRSFDHALSFGVFDQGGAQVGCARMITDRATFAYLADVYLEESCRGKGIGRWMMDVIMAHEDLQGLRRIMLATSDMHPLYRQVGFTDLNKPEIMMEISVPDIYSRHRADKALP
ncbi:GNAT family N-acetyltransferase [Kordiimonas sp.]|uniref:GNAT family N-acetyltransferase n=1 Tax=Kordiimonas sp. TaxID=1970157 RepID=UPI003A94EAA4